jgi:hypothetical protein
VGFICHEDMMGGVQGKDTLTAYVAVALLESGEDTAAKKAITYLEGRVDALDDSYALALVTYALELGGSGKAATAMDKLTAKAVVDENGLHWSGGGVREPGTTGDEEQPLAPEVGGVMPVDMLPDLSVETTGYGTLALLAADDRVNAAQAARWLVGQRNSAASAARETRWWRCRP